MRAWNLIFRVFFAEYLGLHPESSKRDEPSPATPHPPAVKKSDWELVRSCVFFPCKVFLTWGIGSSYYRLVTMFLFLDYGQLAIHVVINIRAQGLIRSQLRPKKQAGPGRRYCP